MRSTLRLPLLALVLLAACAGDPPTGPATRLAPRDRVLADVVPVTTYEEVYVNTVTGGGYTSSGAFFAPSAWATSTLVQDDFVVPAGASWSVTMIGLRGGFGWATNVAVGPVPLVIRADAGGVPGQPVASYTITPTEHVDFGIFTGRYDFALPAPLALGPGTYWLEVSCAEAYFYCGFVGPARIGSGMRLTYTGGTLDGTSRVSDTDLLFALYTTRVLTPDEVATNVEDVLTGLALPGGIETSLLAKLHAARAAIAEGRTTAACQLLASLVNEVNAQAGKALSPFQAAALLREIALLQGALGC